MKPRTFLRQTSLGLLFLFTTACQLRADITVRLSVKFILTPDGLTRPAPGNIGTKAGFDAQITAANSVLAATGRGYKLEATYADIHPPVPAGQDDDYWYNLEARSDSDRGQVENAALAEQAVWKWDQNAINVYVNNTSSGNCSLPGRGHTILFGQSVASPLSVLHEVGHFFGLLHTHAGDPDCSTAQPPYVPANGDQLDSTIDDHACLDTRDSLSMANFGGRTFAQLTASEQTRVNSSWLNVMSYHPARSLLVDQQMDYVWSFWGNAVRNYVCSGSLWYVAAWGSDSYGGFFGGQPFATFEKGLTAVSKPDDVILFEEPGTYWAPSGNVISTPCTLRTLYGPVTIVRSP